MNSLQNFLYSVLKCIKISRKLLIFRYMETILY